MAFDCCSKDVPEFLRELYGFNNESWLNFGRIFFLLLLVGMKQDPSFDAGHLDFLFDSSNIP